MEKIDIFYRIFHEDLHPLTNQKTKGYYLNNIKKLTQNEVTLEDIHTKPRASLRFLFYEVLLSDFQKKMQRSLHEKIFLSYHEQGRTEIIVRNYQALLLNYCRIIENNYFSSEDHNSKFQISDQKTDLDIFKLVYQSLDSILNYLEQIFYKYLDCSLQISHQQKLWFTLKNKEQVSLMLCQIKALEIPELAKNIICAPLLQIYKNELPSFSYQDREYLSVYIKVLRNLLHKENPPSLEMLYKVLISLEFNTFKMFFFLINHFKKMSEDILEVTEKTNILRSFQKEILTTSITSSYKYNPNLPSLKEQLLIWVREEISFLKNEVQLIKPSPENIPKTAVVAPKKKLVHISVSEISLIARLLFETGLLKGPKKKLFQFLSNTFITKKSQVISQESISNRYYSVSEATKLSVEGMLKKMLYTLENMRGEL
ncbi:hypothetical protein [Aquimarina sp. MMG016]|uniref:hypothetical protein n=1 Tax=Aquimarina sp. MMG016 TaxID=2822690 RepID=UPI001B3A0006|nr:hypothetical protein [Aquimarina sp. MMG016]MBQ4818860.1 hypothetical protein [Aquimarina sp. MMG016]